MSLNLNEFIDEVHQNAVNHGWWDGERSIPEIIALIHSEWSEALEEARAGRPMVWYACKEDGAGGVCNSFDCMTKPEDCLYRNPKPEGIAVELIDGCIRILDLFGAYGVKFDPIADTIDNLCKYAGKRLEPTNGSVAEIVTEAHRLTAKGGELMMQKDYMDYGMRMRCMALRHCVAMVMWWLKWHGANPEAVILEKHNYNKTRPYKHGKLF